jgi:group I intron endonuclease
MNNNFVLYMHITPNNKKYFGITGLEVNKRWQNGRGYRKQVFWRAIQKYGWENIGHYILADNLTKEEACFFEQVMIALYDTTNSNNGYNSTTGGEHFKHSEESKQKMSKSLKGRKLTEETRQKLSEIRKGENHPMYGKHPTEEARQKMSESHKGLQAGENNPMYGKHHSEESKQKMSDSRKGKRVGRKHPKFKPIICITTGCCFNTSKEAADYCNLKSRNSIGRCCRGERAFAGKLNGEKLVWCFISDLPRPQLTDSDKMHLRDLLDKYGRASA